ncbi:uncharacterized protein LOC134686536 [Mytilus trossulus]|uniref:uncharacterized protein LOC134686536 n=1 Tax=Mytilus trossulus TaxID=6551 RepID=UPI003004AC48
MAKGDLDNRNKKFQNFDCIKDTTIKIQYLNYVRYSLSVAWYIIKKLVSTETTSALKLLNDIVGTILDLQFMTGKLGGIYREYMITDNKNDITPKYSKELVKCDPDSGNIKNFAKGKEVIECVQDDVAEYSKNDPGDAIIIIRICLDDPDFLSNLYKNGKIQVRHTTRSYFMNTEGLENFLTGNDIVLVLEINVCWIMSQHEDQMRQYLSVASSMLFEIDVLEIFIETSRSSIILGTLSLCRPIYTFNINGNQSVKKYEYRNDNYISPESNGNHLQGIGYKSNKDIPKDSSNSNSHKSKDRVFASHNGQHNKIGTNRVPNRNCVVIGSASDIKLYLENALEQAKLSGLLTPTNPNGPHVHWPSGHPLLPFKVRFIEELTYENEYMERLQSFLLKKNKRKRNWPDENIVRPEPLVNAGFSYEGNDDEVVCKSCRFKSKTDNWLDDDDDYAINIHRQTQNDCAFLGISRVALQSKSVEKGNTVSPHYITKEATFVFHSNPLMTNITTNPQSGNTFVPNELAFSD